jgi:hypothetical protein
MCLSSEEAAFDLQKLVAAETRRLQASGHPAAGRRMKIWLPLNGSHSVTTGMESPTEAAGRGLIIKGRAEE